MSKTASDMDVQEKVSIITNEELMEMMNTRGTEGILKVKQMGGVAYIVGLLGSNERTGLQEDGVEINRKVFGSNVIPKVKEKTFLYFALEALKDPILIILLCCAVFSLGLSFIPKEKDVCMVDAIIRSEEEKKDEKVEKDNNDEPNTDWIEGLAILVAVMIVVLVTAFTDWMKEKQFRKLQEKVEGDKMVIVIRAGLVVGIQVEELVVGDLLVLKYGDLLPADGLVVQARDLNLDESALTGESNLVLKCREEDSMVLAGTKVMEGMGKVVVTAVGVNSQSGQILLMVGVAGGEEGAEIMRNDIREETEDLNKIGKIKKKVMKKSVLNGGHNNEKSVLKTKLNHLAKQIGFAGLSVALLTVLVLSSRYSILMYLNNCSIIWQNYFAFFVTGVTILVVAVPEGLPLAVTLALAYSVRKMMKDKNLVRHLDACETMGNATTICTDKTGTLTTNRMTVMKSYMVGNLYSQDDLPLANELAGQVGFLLSQAIAFNTSYSTNLEKGEMVTHLGNKTECALLAWLGDMGVDYKGVREEMDDSDFSKVYTFNSFRKRMSTVIPLAGGGYRVLTKGAAEVVFRRCSWTMNNDGEVEDLTTTDKQVVERNVIENMATDALRTICVAYKDYIPGDEDTDRTFSSTPTDWDTLEEEITSNLTMLCVVGIEDPVRQEVPMAIEQCQQAGITVRMITGDNLDTARAIATKCGIIKPGDKFLAIEGKEFNRRVRDPETGEVKQELIDKVWPQLRVLARSQPKDKFTLVHGIINSTLTDKREVVAVTGDGTNDAPALKEADVGFAMGIAGTDVAKEASDIILTDDNFKSIVAAVMWGRNVYDSISKFLQFQLTVNIVAIIIAFIGACVTNTSPLKALQMLWINLIMDTLAALSLATEMPTSSLLDRAPYGRTSSLISSRMASSIIGQTVYQLTVLLVMLFIGHTILPGDVESYESIKLDTPPTVLFTVIFNTFLLMTLFNEVNCRKVHGEIDIFSGLFSNPIFLIIWSFSFLAQLVIVQAGGGLGLVFSTTQLSLAQWAVCLGLAAGGLGWHQLVLAVVRTWDWYRREDEVEEESGIMRKMGVDQSELEKEGDEQVQA